MNNWVRIIADPRKPGVLTYECENGHRWDRPVRYEGDNICPDCDYSGEVAPSPQADGAHE